MNEKERVEIERRIQPLLCGGPQALARRELLKRIACDDRAREVLAEMLEDQRDARAAFGYDGIEEAIEDSLERVQASPGGSADPGRSNSDTPARKRPLRGARVVPWLSALAAAMVIGVSLYVALTASSGKRRLEERLARIEKSMAAPAMAVSETEMGEFRFLWNQVAQRPNVWVLIRDGEGQFGSVSSGASPQGRNVVLLQCRVLDEAGGMVYVADLLMPDRRDMSFRLPRAGSVAGRPARMDIATAGDEAAVSFSVGHETDPGAGVTGHARLGGDTREIGRFVLNDQMLRVYVRARRVQGVRT